MTNDRPVRPGAMTAVGVIFMVFGGFGLLATTISLVVRVVIAPTMEQTFAELESAGVAKPDGFGPWAVTMGLLMGALSLTMLIGGRGLLNMRAWARGLMLAVAWISLVVSISYGVSRLVTMFSATTAAATLPKSNADIIDVGWICFCILTLTLLHSREWRVLLAPKAEAPGATLNRAVAERGTVPG